jgi:hypothetical protein
MTSPNRFHSRRLFKLEMLVGILVKGEPRNAPAASEALRVIGTRCVLEHPVDAETTTKAWNAEWVVATIGRLPPDMVRVDLKGTPPLGRQEPMLLLAPGRSRLAGEDPATDMAARASRNDSRFTAISKVGVPLK